MDVSKMSKPAWFVFFGLLAIFIILLFVLKSSTDEKQESYSTVPLTVHSDLYPAYFEVPVLGRNAPATYAHRKTLPNPTLFTRSDVFAVPMGTVGYDISIDVKHPCSNLSVKGMSKEDAFLSDCKAMVYDQIKKRCTFVRENRRGSACCHSKSAVIRGVAPVGPEGNLINQISKHSKEWEALFDSFDSGKLGPEFFRLFAIRFIPCHHGVFECPRHFWLVTESCRYSTVDHLPWDKETKKGDICVLDIRVKVPIFSRHLQIFEATTTTPLDGLTEPLADGQPGQLCLANPNDAELLLYKPLVNCALYLGKIKQTVNAIPIYNGTMPCAEQLPLKMCLTASVDGNSSEEP